MKKVAFIGAGSYGFTFRLVVDILSYDALADVDFVFMDVNEERLGHLKIITEEYFKKSGYGKQPLYTTNLEQSLEGADFVINLVKIGFLEASEMDMDVPKKYGLYQTIGDTCGIGGIFRGLRTMAFNTRLCREIEKRSMSSAVVLNYTNPQAMCVMAASQTSKVPFIGLCHSVQGTSRMIAKYLDVPYEQLDYEAGGINHMNWITKLERNGKDLYPELRRLVQERGIYNDSGMDDDINAALGTTRLDMLQRVGFMVTESSNHFAEYVPYYLRTEETREAYRLIIDKYKSNIQTKENKYRQYVEDAKKGQLPKLVRSVEYGSAIIHAMVTDEPCRIYGNVMNTGNLITNLPEFSSVEVACLVDRNGVHPCHFGELPTQLAAMCSMNIYTHQLAVEAIVNKKRDAVYWAMMMDPVTHSILNLDQMKEIADELIGRQAEYLGEFLQ